MCLALLRHDPSWVVVLSCVSASPGLAVWLGWGVATLLPEGRLEAAGSGCSSRTRRPEGAKALGKSVSEITQGTVYQRQFVVTAPGAGLGPVALHHRVGEHGGMALHYDIGDA